MMARHELKARKCVDRGEARVADRSDVADQRDGSRGSRIAGWQGSISITGALS
jgi:hypothetical protein